MSPRTSIAHADPLSTIAADDSAGVPSGHDEAQGTTDGVVDPIPSPCPVQDDPTAPRSMDESNRVFGWALAIALAGLMALLTALLMNAANHIDVLP